MLLYFDNGKCDLEFQQILKILHFRIMMHYACAKFYHKMT